VRQADWRIGRERRSMRVGVGVRRHPLSAYLALTWAISWGDSCLSAPPAACPPSRATSRRRGRSSSSRIRWGRSSPCSIGSLAAPTTPVRDRALRRPFAHPRDAPSAVAVVGIVRSRTEREERRVGDPCPGPRVGLVGVGLAVPRPRISAVRGCPFEIPLPAELPERGVVLAALPRLSALARL